MFLFFFSTLRHARFLIGISIFFFFPRPFTRSNYIINLRRRDTNKYVYTYPSPKQIEHTRSHTHVRHIFFFTLPKLCGCLQCVCLFIFHIVYYNAVHMIFFSYFIHNIIYIHVYTHTPEANYCCYTCTRLLLYIYMHTYQFILYKYIIYAVRNTHTDRPTTRMKPISWTIL